jgi:hypothetical protein
VRILHVVTLVSPDSAYGGPVRVAENQCTELLSRGHDVHIAAGVRGYESVPDTVPPGRRFPGWGSQDYAPPVSCNGYVITPTISTSRMFIWRVTSSRCLQL